MEMMVDRRDLQLRVGELEQQSYLMFLHSQSFYFVRGEVCGFPVEDSTLLLGLELVIFATEGLIHR
jgi:hypothetical protein